MSTFTLESIESQKSIAIEHQIASISQFDDTQQEIREILAKLQDVTVISESYGYLIVTYLGGLRTLSFPLRTILDD